MYDPTGDEAALQRQRKAQQHAAYAHELEQQMANNKRRKQRDQLEQEARDRREEEQVLRERAQPYRRGGGGEPIRMADGQAVAALHLLKEETEAGRGPISGALAEAARLRDEARMQAQHASEEVLLRLAHLEEQVSAASERLDKPSAGGALGAESPSADPLEAPPNATAADGAADDEQYYDALLEEFLNRGADLRGS